MAKGTIGGKIVLEGEKQYKQALKEIKSAQVELKSEMKLCAAEFKNNDKSVEALTKKHQIMTKQVEQSSKKVDTYKKMVQASADAQQKAADKVKSLQSALEEEKNKLTELAKAEGTSNEALEEQRKKIDSIQSALDAANQNYTAAAEKTNRYQTALNNANVELISMNDELADNDKALREANSEMDPLNKNIEEYEKNVEDASKSTNVFGDVLKANLTSEAIISTVKALSSAIIGIAKASIETGMEFEASMSKVEALSGATGTELELLTEKAKEMGASTMYSASQAADALSYMALAGWDSKDMLEGIEPILNMAAAANMDLAQASDIVTDYLTAFGLEAKDATKFTDQLAYAMAHSNTDVVQLGEAFKGCAATAGSMGISVEEITAVLMTMANAGIKGGEAGTALNAILTRLATNASECGDKLQAIVGEDVVYDAAGNMKELSSILDSLAGVWNTLSDAEQASLAKSIAGTNHYSKLQTIMAGLSDNAKQAGMSFSDYSAALEHCDGSAVAMANTMQDNLKGKLTILESAMDALKESSYETFDDALKTGVDGATEAISRLNTSVKSGSLNVSLQRVGESLSKVAVSGINLGEKALPKMIDGLAWILDNASIIAAGVGGIVAAQVAMNTVLPIIQGAVAAWNAFKVANEGATVAQWALNVAMEANPVGLIVTAIAGLTAATVAYMVSLDKQKTEAEQVFDSMIEGYSGVVQASNELAESSKDFAKSTQNEYEYVQALVQELKTLNEKETLSADEKTRIAEITRNLNERYQDLNLQIDEQTGKISENQRNWESLITTQLKQAQVASVQDKLSEIYKKQADNEFALWEIEKDLADNDQRRIDIDKRLLEIQAKGSDANQAELNEMRDLYDEAERLTDQDQELINKREELSASNDDLIESTQQLNDYLENSVGVSLEVANAIDEQSNAMDRFADGSHEMVRAGFSIIEMSEEEIKALQEMSDAILESVDKQMNVFEEFDQKTEVSKEKLLSNLESQLKGVSDWADNISSLAERGIDQGLLQTLAEMGPEGAAYVSAFVSMTDEELKGYSDKFQKAAVLPDQVTSQIMASYRELGQKNAEEYKNAQIERLTGVTLEEMTRAGQTVGEKTDKAVADGIKESDASKKGAEKQIDDALKAADQVTKEKGKKTGKAITEEVGAGMLESDAPTKSAEKIATDVMDTFTKDLASDKAKKIGKAVAEGLAEGLAEGESKVKEAANKLASGAYNSSKKELDINSPSKKFKYLGLMSGQGYADGLAESMVDTSRIMNSMINGVESVQPHGGMQLSTYKTDDRIIEVLNQYLPKIASGKNIKVESVIRQDNDYLFNQMRTKAEVFEVSKGYKAF